MLLRLSADKIDFIRDIVALMVVISVVVLVAYDGVVISAKIKNTDSYYIYI